MASASWLHCSIVLLAAPLAVHAAENFYQVIDPNGNVQIIHGAQPEKATEPSAPAAKKPKPEVAEKPMAAPEAGQPAPVAPAPYDSDVYLDSELIDNARPVADANSRFYVINDGGPGVLSLGEGGESLPVSEFPLTGAVVTEQADSLPLPIERRLLSAERALHQWPQLPRCFAKDKLDSGRIVEVPAQSLILDKQSYAFPEGPQTVAIFRLGGAGLRSIMVRSFARTDRNPAHASPALALLDQSGCLNRVVGGYFERSYPATNMRHAMLEGAIDVHAEEQYLLVLAVKDEAAASSPYKQSNYGQLMFSLKK
jgi:hypothetical protein